MFITLFNVVIILYVELFFKYNCMTIRRNCFIYNSVNSWSTSSLVCSFLCPKIEHFTKGFYDPFLQTNFAIFPHVLQKKKDDNIKKGVDVKKFLFNLKIHICRQISTILAANFLCYIAKTRMSTSISSEAQKYKTI